MKRIPTLSMLLQKLDTVVPPEHRPSSWSADGLMALLVGATRYPRSIALAYRSALTWKAVKYWCGRNDITQTSVNLLICCLDDLDDDVSIDVNVAYLKATGLVGQTFGPNHYDCDHLYLSLAGCPMVFHCARDHCIDCKTELSSENVLQRDETSKKPGGCLGLDAEFTCTKVTVLSVDHGKRDGIMFFRRCPKCDMM